MGNLKYIQNRRIQGDLHGYWYSVNSTTKVISIDPNKPTPVSGAGAGGYRLGKEVYKALHPANRWRDGHDFLEVSVNKPAKCFVAPDGVTIIPVCYDLMRATNLLEAYPISPSIQWMSIIRRRLVRCGLKRLPGKPQDFAEKGKQYSH